MEKIIGITEARESLESIVDEVQYKNNKYVIKRHGKPAVAVVPMSVYESWKRSRERFFEIVDKVQSANKEVDPDEVMELVLEVQRETKDDLRQHL